MQFTAFTTLAFADIPLSARAPSLATMPQQVSMTLAVAFAALTLAVSQMLRGVPALTLTDFHYAWFTVGTLMALATLGALRLPHDAGIEVSRKV